MLTPEQIKSLDSAFGITPESRAGADLDSRKQAMRARVEALREKPSEEEEDVGGFQSFVQSLAKPVLKVGSTVSKLGTGAAGLGMKALGEITDSERLKQAGDLALKEGADTSATDFGYLGKVAPIGYTEKGEELKGARYVADIIGTGAELASLIAAPSGAAKAMGKETVKQMAKTGAAEGAKLSGLGALGGSLQEQAKEGEISAGRTFGDTALGVVLGAGLGAAVPGAIGGIRAAKNIIRPTEEAFPKIVDDIAESYSKSLNLTKLQSTGELRWGKNTPKFLAQESIVNPRLRLQEGPNRTLDATEALDELRKISKAENDAFKSILRDENKFVSLEEYRAKALRDINTPENRALGEGFIKMEKQVNDEIDALKKVFSGVDDVIKAGDDISVPLDVFNQIKQGRWASVRNWAEEGSKLYNNTNFQMGETAKEMIEGAIDSADVKIINKRLGEIAQAIHILDQRNGSKLLGGFLGRKMNAVIGAVVGSGGGPVGAAFGALSGEKISDILLNPEISNGYKRWLITRLENSPKLATVVEQAKEILAKNSARRAATPRLPAPSFMEGQPWKGGESKVITTPKKYGSLFNYLQEIEASQKAAGLKKPDIINE